MYKGLTHNIQNLIFNFKHPIEQGNNLKIKLNLNALLCKLPNIFLKISLLLFLLVLNRSAILMKISSSTFL